MGEHDRLNKITAPNICENPYPLDFFLLYFQTVISLIVKETNCCMQQDSKTRNKLDFPDSQKINTNDLYTIIVHMGYDHKPGTILYCTKDKLYHIPFYSSVMP
jgi:hypothetical protein